MRLPTFICIGAQKSATSWLYTMLQQHPKVWLPPIQELHFFDRINSKRRKMRVRHRVLAEKHKRLGAAEDRGVEWAEYLDRITAFDEISLTWYREVFSWPVDADVTTGEITPAYLEMSESDVQFARELLGDIKVIVIVRRPLDRELSQLRMAASRISRRPDAQPETVEDWMKIYDSMVGTNPRGSYSSGIPIWQGAFSHKNFLALPFADVREAPQMLMERIEAFLEIPSFAPYSLLTKKVHKTKKADIPPEVIARAAERVAKEDVFLKRHFGDDFYRRTK